jgi:hypothetical protein
LGVEAVLPTGVTAAGTALVTCAGCSRPLLIRTGRGRALETVPVAQGPMSDTARADQGQIGPQRSVNRASARIGAFAVAQTTAVRSRTSYWNFTDSVHDASNEVVQQTH